MDDRARLEAIRDAMPATRAVHYLNTGTCGPIPRVVHEVQAAHAAREFEAGRIRPGTWEAHAQTRADARRRLAALLGAGADEIALTHHTTEGMNIVALGLTWRPADEVVTTTQEHPGGHLPLAVLRLRYGVNVRYVDLGDGDDAAGRILDACGPRTRLVAVSHVLWTTGAVLPVEEIARAARQRGIFVLVDGAQSAGAIPLDVGALGVDAYAVPGQKWLCGPEGTGALWVRRDAIPQVQPTFAGFATAAAYDFTGYFLPSPGAGRYETGSTHRPSWAGWVAGLGWLADEVGWAWIHDRIGRLAARARRGLAGVAGVTVLTPPRHAGLVSFRVAGREPAAVVEALAAGGYLVRSIPDAGCVRVSNGFFNTEDEVDGLVAEVARLAGGTA